MMSELMSVCAFTGAASIAFAQRQVASQRRVLSLLVGIGLFNVIVLGGSGYFREGAGILATVHAAAGHIMAPLVLAACGLWFGASYGGIRRTPFRVLPRLSFLTVLCFFCLSNTWTGYFGPTRVDHSVDQATEIRFVVLHCWGVPGLIAAMLSIWLWRTAARPSAFAVGSYDGDMNSDRHTQ